MVDNVNQEENPIAEADKESVDRLFNKDPQFLTQEDLAKIVERLRANRGTWLKKEKKTPGTSRGGKKVLEKAEMQALLADLKL
jgi:hypothetical protein